MKYKILFLVTALLLNMPAYCLGKTKNPGENLLPVTQIKGSVSDYKTEIINLEWWDKFNDPILSEYIMKALQANQDIKIAGLRVSEYKQFVKASLGNEFPTLGIGSNISTQLYSKNYIPLFSGTLENYTFPLTASYELDIWGKNRDRTKSVKKQLEAISYDEKAALISIVTEVASVYMNVLKIDQDIKYQNQLIDLKNKRLELVQARLNEGLGTNDEIISREKDLTDAKILLNEYKKSLGILKSALAVLTGESPDNINEMKFGSIDNIEALSNLTDKIESDKILKRPDILRAEAQLQKSKIDVNVVRKEFLPDIALTGQFGFNATSFSKVFAGNSLTYGFAANIFETLFTGGRRMALLKSKKYSYDQIFENYQKTLLTSLKEVNDSLLSVKTSQQRNEDCLKKINLEKDNLKLTDARYQEGVISYLDTLEPKERLVALEKDQLQSKTDYIIDNFTLYKALGANF